MVNRDALLIGAVVGGAIMIFPHFERELVARIVWGEARSEGAAGMQGVVNVMDNRRKRNFAGTLIAVATQRRQFSAFNEDDPNRPKLLAVTNDPALDTARELVEQAQAGDLIDITGGADHYHTLDVSPAWADPRKVTATLGRHVFYNLRG